MTPSTQEIDNKYEMSHLVGVALIRNVIKTRNCYLQVNLIMNKMKPPKNN